MPLSPRVVVVVAAFASLLMRPGFSCFVLSSRAHSNNIYVRRRLFLLTPSSLLSTLSSGIGPPLTRLPSTAVSGSISSSSSSISMKRPLPDSGRGAGDRDEPRKPLVVIVAGPTGVGKSSVAMSLCQASNASQLMQSCGLTVPPGTESGGNIISADSVQAYRGVQVGANKPTDDERAACPHHLIDVAGADETYNAADWMRDAVFAIEKLFGREVNVKRNVDDDEEDNSLVEEEVLESRRKRKETILHGIVQAREQGSIPLDAPILPVVVGGTMMYLQWLVHGRPDAMRPTDEALERAASDIKKFQAMDGGTFDNAGNTETEAKTESSKEETSDATLSAGWNAAVDYASSLGKPFKARVDKLCGKDWYRLRRILEVAYTAGAEKATEEQLQAVYSGERYGGLGTRGYDVRCFFLCPDDRLKHAEVIDRRCEDMLQRGLLNETASLSVAGELPDDGQPARAIGYRQTLDYLRRKDAKRQDNAAFNAYVDEFTTATRRYAKKQMGWFRKDEEFMFIPVSMSKPSQERVDEAANSILQMCKTPRNEYERELLSQPPKAREIPGSKTKKSKGATGIDPDTLSLSAKTKLQNEKQGKDMKFYQGGKRYQIVEGTSERTKVMAEADASTATIQGLNDLPS